ncbi:MAG: hypothetical protein FWH03_00760 [Firmicutes bacterium]|nr:hypothetical protein [Bacillota bacterium]
MEIKIVKTEFKNGVSKKTNKPYTALDITYQGKEKFTVTKMLFLSDTEYQLLGIEKPKA